MRLATVTKIVLTIEYEGTRYYGFQLQVELPTIQAELETALRKLTGEKTRVMAASRTDTGVHARGQVVSFRTGSSLPVETFVKGLNYYLPDDIAVKAAFRVDDSFDVRRNAINREYKYYILNSQTRSPLRHWFSYLVAGELDVGDMNKACQALTGEHDFASFVACSEMRRKGTVRNIYRVGVEKKEDMVVFDVVADSFLRHQVRNTVGALIRVGLGKMPIDEFGKMVGAETPGLAGPKAPSCGLCLIQVNYPSPLGA